MGIMGAEDSDKSGTESSSSGSGRMERIRPEKTPRQRVQKIWRNVRWANSFEDEALTIDSGEISSNFALRKIALLFETKKFEECATLIRRMNFVTLGNILAEVPLEVLYDSMPYSLTILEALYVKLYDTNYESFPKEQLCFDQLLKRMVACFARLPQTSSRGEKNCNTYYPSCRNILRVVFSVEPQVKQQIRQKKKALDKCLKHLGQHGLVDCSSGHLMHLHDAMKLEFEKIVSQYRSALQKLDEMSLVSAKHPTSSSVTFGKAPSSASHQRLMQMTRGDVQNRIIKNKTLYNIVEPALTNECLKKLMHILEKRIEYDKFALFYDTEIRKFCDGMSEDASMCMILRHFSQGYNVVYQLLKEVSDDEDERSDDDGGHSTDEELLSPITHMDKVKTLPGQLNGFHHYKGNGGSTSRLRNGRTTSGLRPSIISGPFPVKQDANGIRNGYAKLVPHSLQYTVIPVLDSESDYSSSGKSDHVTTIKKLEKEVEQLQSELQQSREAITRLQESERELNERLSNHVPLPYMENNNEFEVPEGLGPNEWIGRYAALYSHGRTDAVNMLDRLEQLGELQALKEKIVFSVIVLAFRGAQQAAHELRGKLRHLLNLPHPDIRSKSQTSSQQHMDRHIGQYLCDSADKFDLSDIIQEVCSQIYATLYDYPCLKDCEGLHDYVTVCVRTAWGLSVQNPPYLLCYDSRTFHPDMHNRFHDSDPSSENIRSFIWPALTEGYGGSCVHKGIVVT